MYKEYPKFYNYETFDYGRKSRTDDPLLSVEEVLEKHNSILEEYAIKHLGGPIPEENKFREVGSGESLADRPEIQRLLKAIESPAIKAVMVVDVQRLSRGDLEDAGKLIRILRYTNTYVITPHKIYDLRDEYDRDAFERELKRGSEYLEYYKKIQARGRLASVKEGNYIGSVAPYGFERTIIEDGKKVCHTLKENKAEADIVRLVFEWYCNEDIGVTAICRRLESMNIKSKGGGKIWRSQTIFSMLENVHYIGCVRWNWRKTIKIIEDSEIRKLRPKSKVDEYLIFEGKHDGIVSEELFNKAQEMRGKRHRTKTDTSLKNPFSGLMYCKACGAKIGYNTYRKNGVEYAPPKLVCNNQVHCKSGSVAFHEVMEYVCNTLKDCISDFAMRIDNNQDNSVKLHKDLVERLEKQLMELDKKEILQWEAQYDPDLAMPQHIFKKLNEKLLAEKEEIKKALSKAKGSIPKDIDYKELIVKFEASLEMLQDPTVSAKIKNQYLRDIIERMEYTRPPSVRIIGKNQHLYQEECANKQMFHNEPYKITIKLKS